MEVGDEGRGRRAYDCFCYEGHWEGGAGREGWREGGELAAGMAVGGLGAEDVGAGCAEGGAGYEFHFCGIGVGSEVVVVDGREWQVELVSEDIAASFH